MCSLFFGGGSSYRAEKLNLEEPFHQRPDDVPGVLLRLRPYKGKREIADAVSFFRSIHEVETSFWGKNRSLPHTFEIWFHEGKLKFYLYASSEEDAAAFRRRVGSTYASSEVTRVADAPTFPSIGQDEYVAGARLDTTKRYGFPIRQHQVEGFDTDPYGKITNEMLSRADTAVVTQVIFRPAKASWADGDWLLNNSVEELADGLRQGQSKGWIDRRILDPGETDREAAEAIERQRSKPAYHTSVRVAAISPDQYEAASRARDVAGMFAKHYDALTGQGFDDVPVSHRRKRKRISSLQQHVEWMVDRLWVDRRIILTVDELAGVAHVPGVDIETPNVDWLRAKGDDTVTIAASRSNGGPIGARDDGPTTEGDVDG